MRANLKVTNSAHPEFLSLGWANMIFWDKSYKYIWLTVDNWFNEQQSSLQFPKTDQKTPFFASRVA